MSAGLAWNVSDERGGLPDDEPSPDPLMYTKEFCWNVTFWAGSLAEEVETADSLTTCTHTS